MPEVYFSHPDVNAKMGGPLRISTGANEITWGYGLNYQTFPTFGGEVVQILSAYTDDLVVQGEVRTYAEMEYIYEWLLAYLRTATQDGDFVQTPISFRYDARGWHQEVIVTELPGFRYGRDVVVPEYQIKAHVGESHGDLNDHILNAGRDAAMSKRGIDLDNFGRVTAAIGYVERSPFSDPFPDLSASEIDQKTRELYQQIGDHYASFIPSYAQGNFKDLAIDYGSVPAFLGGGTGSKDGPKNVVGERAKSGAK